jgi:hypothetical protein
MIKRLFSNKILLYFIFAVAVVLRFYNYFNIPFTHDEFSALFRTDFDSFRELIEKGVKVDGHPAGIQVFLYYWVQLFGMHEWIVKLPFTLMGIAAIWFAFLIGKKWYNVQAGLLIASFLAVSQFTVSYSVIARPYISGFFFTLAMFYYWSQIILARNTTKSKYLVLFVLFASLSAYNHHFSMLFAVITGLLGLFMVNAKNRLRYILSGAVVIILYLPHLPVLLSQLEIGGVGGWLGKPTASFFWNFHFYLFHYSMPFFLVFICVIILGIILQKSISFSVRRFVLFTSLSLLPFFIGYYYSIYVNAVLQYSVLIFSFVYLFFFIFGLISKVKQSIAHIFVFIITTVGIITLVYNREHYKLLHNSIYERVIEDAKSIDRNRNEVCFVLNSNTRITSYYLNKEPLDFKTIRIDKVVNLSKSVKILDSLKNRFSSLYYGATASKSPHLMGFITSYYPYFEFKNDYFKGNTYLFSQNSGSPIADTIESKFLKENEQFRLKNSSEWGPAILVNLEETQYSKNDYFDVVVNVTALDTIRDIKLVASIKSGAKTIYWNETNFKRFYAINDTAQRFVLHNVLKLSDINLNYDSLKLHTYLWNKTKGSYKLNSFTVRRIHGNPIVYGEQGTFY